MCTHAGKSYLGFTHLAVLEVACFSSRSGGGVPLANEYKKVERDGLVQIPSLLQLLCHCPCRLWNFNGSKLCIGTISVLDVFRDWIWTILPIVFFIIFSKNKRGVRPTTRSAPDLLLQTIKNLCIFVLACAKIFHTCPSFLILHSISNILQSCKSCTLYPLRQAPISHRFSHETLSLLFTFLLSN